MKTTLLQPLQNPLRPCRHVLYRGQVSGILSQVGESTGGEVLSAAEPQFTKGIGMDFSGRNLPSGKLTVRPWQSSGLED